MQEFQQVLDLLGLPGETLHIDIGGRAEAMVGQRSSWRMRAVIADQPGLPYTTRTVHVPVLLPGDPPPLPPVPHPCSADDQLWAAPLTGTDHTAGQTAPDRQARPFIGG